MARFLNELAKIERDVLYGYRLRSDGRQVSGQRSLFYTLAGSAVASNRSPISLIINCSLIGLLFMFFGAYDNYWDWRLLGERNATSAIIERRRLSWPGGLLWVFAPWLGIVPGLFLARRFGMSPQSEIFFWLMTSLGFAYMTPGVRMKGRSFDFLIAPVWACLLFLQSCTWQSAVKPGPVLLMLCAAVFSLQCYAELLHRLDDSQLIDDKALRLKVVSGRLKKLRYLLGASIASSLVAALLIHPIFINTAFWSSMRLYALRRVEMAQLTRLRRQFWQPLWSLYEFGIYGLVGIFWGLV